MNALEHYIEKIYSISKRRNVVEDGIIKQYDEYGNVLREEVDLFNTKENLETVYMIVDLESNCYGDIRRSEQWFNEEEWEKVQLQGYFIA